VGKKSLFLLFISLYILLRLIFNPIELTGDSYGYACEILKGDLWNPHHLLHKFVLRDLWILASSIHVIRDPLHFFQLTHAFAGILSIWVLFRILELRHWRYSIIALAITLILSSFVFIKYSTENEVYFYPILLSLVGSMYFEKGKKFSAAFWLGFATLFHQIHIFWLIGVLMPKPQRQFTPYRPLAFALSIPLITYILFAVHFNTSLNQLIFKDVHEGLVQVVPNGSNVIFFMVNLFRVFIQVHGDIPLFWKLWNPFYSGLAIINIILMGIGATLFLLRKSFVFNRKEWVPAYSIALLLQLFFAWYSVGNIEFMVLVPFLLVLSFRSGELLSHSLVLIVSLLVWNVSQWVLPLNKYPTQRLEEKVALIERIDSEIAYEPFKIDTDNGTLKFIETDEAAVLQNYYEYQCIRDTTRTQKFHFIPYPSPLPSSYRIVTTNSRLKRSKMAPLLHSNIRDTSDLLVYKDTGITGTLEIIRKR
jgi:hypothetical protein